MRAINYTRLMDISFSTEEEGSADVHSIARFEIIGATPGSSIRSIDRMRRRRIGF